MLKGLEENNIKINTDYEKLDDLVKEIKSNPISYRTEDVHKAISNPIATIDRIFSRNEGSGLLSEIQYNLGLRYSEAKELLQNSEIYIRNFKVEHLKGKGNHEYRLKEITRELANKILGFKGRIPSLATYNKHIKCTAGNEDKSSHSFRYSYVEKSNNLGLSHKYISKEINHHRLEITRYYLQRA